MIALGLFLACGAACFGWMHWLDRNRKELPTLVEAMLVPAWPVLFPYLLWRREDLSPGQAVRVGIQLCAGLALALWVVSPRPLPEPPAPAPPPINGTPIVIAPEPYTAPEPAPNTHVQRTALQHWNSGIIHYQAGDFRSACAEWSACQSMDPENADCRTGMLRLEQVLGRRLDDCRLAAEARNVPALVGMPK